MQGAGGTDRRVAQLQQWGASSSPEESTVLGPLPKAVQGPSFLLTGSHRPETWAGGPRTTAHTYRHTHTREHACTPSAYWQLCEGLLDILQEPAAEHGPQRNINKSVLPHLLSSSLALLCCSSKMERKNFSYS